MISRGLESQKGGCSVAFAVSVIVASFVFCICTFLFLVFSYLWRVGEGSLVTFVVSIIADD